MSNYQFMTWDNLKVYDDSIKEYISDDLLGYNISLVRSTADDNYAATYILSQGVGDKSIEIGRINIFKDLVVKNGEVVKDPEGQTPGVYLKLLIQNQENPIYINVADLVDAYTTKQEATQIQISISETNEISAVIVPGSVSSIELSINAVTTEKITDKSVTKEKLAQSIQDNLDRTTNVKVSNEIPINQNIGDIWFIKNTRV